MTKICAPMVETKYQVQKTYDYSLFKTLQGNRTLNELHKKRLRDSLSENYLFSPILVNENFEIIDGQHRAACCEELNLPIYFIVCNGYGLPEIQILNANMKNWNADDFMQGYCDLGVNDYLIYRDFKEKYGFSHNDSMNLLAGANVANMDYLKDFRKGTFKVRNLEQAERWAEQILKLEPYFEFFKFRTFVMAIIQMFKKPEFDFEEFLHKLKLQPTRLKKCATVAQYVELIEDIYNYRRTEKVTLRF